MRVLVTRPQPQADDWSLALQTQGLQAHALPLMAIEGPAQVEPVHQAWLALNSIRLLMFVSPAAVSWFFRLHPPHARWPSECLAATPGPGTAKALLAEGQRHGLSAAQLLCPPDQAEQFDSEALWPVLQPLDWQNQNVLIVSGGDQAQTQGRTWLADRLREHGAHVQALLTYQRGPGHWTAAEQALAHQALHHPADHIWLFSSSQAIHHLVAHHLPAWPALPRPPWAQMHALATHPKIAEQARQLGLIHIAESRPTLNAVASVLRAELFHH